MKINKNPDYIQNSDVLLYQSDAMFKVNTDTSLLAHFMNVKRGEKILDIGTNNGALLLYAAKKCQLEHLYGIDIQPDAIEIAKYNMEKANIKNATLIVGDVQTTKLDKVNVVVCNPPYFKTDLSSHLKLNTSLRIATHETYLKLDNLCQITANCLDTKGRFYLIHRADRLVEIVNCCSHHRLQIKTIQFVYDSNKPLATCVLIEAYKDGLSHTKIIKPITISHD